MDLGKIKLPKTLYAGTMVMPVPIDLSKARADITVTLSRDFVVVYLDGIPDAPEYDSLRRTNRERGLHFAMVRFPIPIQGYDGFIIGMGNLK